MKSEVIDQFVESHGEQYAAISDTIWRYAELGYQERDSSRIHIDNLKVSGFSVREGVAGIPTAFIAEAGSGGPVIGILGEFDALSGLSQSSMAVSCMPSVEIANGNGHGCGHHLLGVSAHLAAVTVKHLLESYGLPGTVRFYGCPAEEGGWGKSFMAREGVFDDLDAALTWHPWTVNAIWNKHTLAVKQAYFRFSGISAHAGYSPHLGRSALDAVELMNVGSNYLREHIIPSARVHYAVTNAGGVAPNVVSRMRFLKAAIAVCPLALSVSATAQQRDESEVVFVGTSDPDMVAAMKQARATLPDFLKLASAPPSGTGNYKLQVMVIDGDRTEHFWVAPFKALPEGFAGAIANDPSWLRGTPRHAHRRCKSRRSAATHRFR